MMRNVYPRARLEAAAVGLFFWATLLIPDVSFAMDGAQLFASKCTPCHGPKGQGTPVGPTLKGDPFVIQGASAEIKKVIMMGRAEKEKKYPNIANPMPSGMASEAEADALVLYLKGDLQK